MIKNYILLSICLFAVACFPAHHRSNPQIVVEPNRIDLRLAEAAGKAADAMAVLAEVESAKNPVPFAQKLDNIPPELKRTVTINWIGPVAQIAKRMSERASYGFAELGDEPPVPIIVNLDVINVPVVDVLRDIGLQMGQRGSVVVDAKGRKVEVHYAPAIQ